MILLLLFINDEDLLSEELEVVLVAVVCAEYVSVEVDNAASGDNGNTNDDDDNFAAGGNDDDNKDIFVFSTRSYEADGLEDDANGELGIRRSFLVETAHFHSRFEDRVGTFAFIPSDPATQANLPAYHGQCTNAFLRK
uniref:Uncharacterized protein n=1 Tax=Glossina austeni TaxID=7395 RepID=A0A1A9V0G9_GLOAU